MAHIGAGFLVATTPLPWPARIGLWLALIASLVHTTRRHGWRSGTRAVTSLELAGDGQCALRHGDASDWQDGEVVRAVVRPWVVLLALRPGGRRQLRYLLVPADAVAAEPFRRLRARLRLESRAG